MRIVRKSIRSQIKKMENATFRRLWEERNSTNFAAETQPRWIKGVLLEIRLPNVYTIPGSPYEKLIPPSI